MTEAETEIGEVTEYACALSESRGSGVVAVWLPGRLQVTVRSLRFTGGERRVQHLFSEIQAIVKSPSLPSAIEIHPTSSAGSLIFSGFRNVDEALVHLRRAWVQPPRLQADLKHEVQSALNLCRAALEHCRDEQCDVSRTSVVDPTGRLHRDQEDDHSDMSIFASQQSKKSSGSTAQGLALALGNSRIGSKIEKRVSGMDCEAVSAAWGAEWLTKHNGTVRAVAVSPHLRFAASASGDHHIHISQLGSEDGPFVPPSVRTLGGDRHCDTVAVLRGHKHIVSGVEFSHDGSILVSSSHDKTLRVWVCHAPGDKAGHQQSEGLGHPPSPWRLLAVIEGHADLVSCVALRPQHESAQGDAGWSSAQILDLALLSGSADGRLVLWRISLSATCHGLTNQQAGIPHRHLLAVLPALRFSVPCPASPDARGQYLAAQSGDGTFESEALELCQQWAARWCCEARWLPAEDCHAGAVATCAWVPDGMRFISGAADGAVAMCRRHSSEGDPDGRLLLWRTKAHTRRVVAAVVSSDGCRVVSCSEEPRLLVYDGESGHVTQTLDMGTTLALSLAWGVDEECVMVATGGKRIKVFHLPSSCALGSLTLPLLRDGVPQRVTCLAWDPTHRGMLLGLADFSVVYMHHASTMVQQAVVGCCTRKGLQPPPWRTGGGDSVGLSQLFASGSSLSSAKNENLFSTLDSSASVLTPRKLPSRPGPRPPADVGEHRDAFCRRASEGPATDAGAGSKPEGREGEVKARCSSRPWVLPTRAPQAIKADEKQGRLPDGQSPPSRMSGCRYVHA